MLKGSGSQTLFKDKWPLMRPVVLKLIKQEQVTREEWQDLFWDVHSVSSWDEKGPTKIQHSLETEIVNFVKGAKTRVMEHEEDSVLLKAYISEWTKYFTQCSFLPMPFQAMETATGNTKVNKKNPEGNRVYLMMLHVWNTHIFTDIRHRLQLAAINLLEAERNGEVFDSQLVVGVRESYVNLSPDVQSKLKIYTDNFEKAYIESAREYYQSKASAYLTENGIVNYMKYADMKLQEEEKRARKYLETRKGCSSVLKLTDALVEVLVSAHQGLMAGVCAKLISQNEIEKLRWMHNLLRRISEGVQPMLQHLEEFIIQTGIDDMKACADVILTDSEKYMEELLKLFDRFSNLVKDAFTDDPQFLTARDKAFKNVVNDTSLFKLDLPASKKGSMASSRTQAESKCPELLANYCDLLLRKSPYNKKLTSEEVEMRLKQVLLVLKYVQNKDVFMRYYKTHLTRRLILETSADSEKEEAMVEWLREVGMPAEYINKLARMFQDIKVSEDLNRQFKDQHKDSAMSDILNIKVLNSGSWARSSERVPVSLPWELDDFIPDVEDFYKKKHCGRKLTWHHLMSNGVITFQNSTGRFDLEVTAFQMAVMFAWNQRSEDRLSFEDLRLATNLPEPELKRTLWSLVAFPKMKRQVLLMEPVAVSAKDLSTDTSFWVNQDFCLIKAGKVQKRGKINLIGRLQLTTEKTKEEDNDDIVTLRILRTQEAIVKIMKMRKRITNAALQSELIEILKNMFIPPKKMVKEQIEWLIENKYMKRDDDNFNTFVYLA